nr:hypothetical protein GCM10025732_00060 [Glycomyces mayteni]
MQRLTAEGLLVIPRRRGLAVKTMTPEDVRDIHWLRATIEPELGRRLLTLPAAERRTVLAELGTEVKRMQRALRRDDARALGDAYLDFHRVLASWGGSVRLARMLATLLIETRLCTFSMFEHFEVHRDLVPEHVAFVEALAADDGERFGILVRAHLEAEVGGSSPNPRTPKRTTPTGCSPRPPTSRSRSTASTPRRALKTPAAQGVSKEVNFPTWHVPSVDCAGCSRYN